MSRGAAGGKKSTVLLIILAVVVLAFIFWWVSRAPETEVGVPTSTPTPQDETLQEVNQLDLGDVDSEFQNIDQDLNSL